jgi:hypothetical protein
MSGKNDHSWHSAAARVADVERPLLNLELPASYQQRSGVPFSHRAGCESPALSLTAAGLTPGHLHSDRGPQ